MALNQLERIGHEAHRFQELSHRALLDANDLDGVGQLVLDVSQPQGRVDKSEREREQNGKHDNEHGIEEEQDQIAAAEDTPEDGPLVRLLLATGGPNRASCLGGKELDKDVPEGKQDRNTENHLVRVDQSDKQEHGRTHQEVISLVIKQILHDPIAPLFKVLQIGQLEPGRFQQKIVDRAQRGQLQGTSGCRSGHLELRRSVSLSTLVQNISNSAHGDSCQVAE